jgi:uncharacterized coiled-coil protein SlyX
VGAMIDEGDDDANFSSQNAFRSEVLLQRRVTELEQHAAEQRRQLAERNDELDAARAANRDLMTQLNRPTPRV